MLADIFVAPGFIDLHTHYDAQIHWDAYCTISSWHGVTSVTIGNCGFGFAPLRAQDAERAMLALSRNEAIPLEPMKVSIQVDWETFPQYMDALARMPLGINISHLFPVAPAVAYEMGGFDAAKQRFRTNRRRRPLSVSCTRLWTPGRWAGRPSVLFRRAGSRSNATMMARR